jgi:hypothetical protein
MSQRFVVPKKTRITLYSGGLRERSPAHAAPLHRFRQTDRPGIKSVRGSQERYKP